MFSNKYRYIFIVVLALFTYLTTELCRVYYYFDIRIEWYYAFATILAITTAIWELNRWFELLVRKYLRNFLEKQKHLIVFFIVGCFLTTLITTIIVLTVGMVVKDYSFSETIEPLKLNFIYAWLANLLFHLVNAIFFYLNEYKNKLIEANNLKQMSIQAELQIVKNQINPHFLFNNLNVLSSLIMQNNSEANQFIEEFSKVYRYILNNNEKELVELDQELHFIEPYIFLLQKRFSEGIKFNITIADNKRQLLIVPASLQMLIENAIKHNIVSTKRPLYIQVHVNGNDTMVISNNLQAKQTYEESTGIGLQNIIKRYRLVTNREVLITSNDDIFSVTIPLIERN